MKIELNKTPTSFREIWPGSSDQFPWQEMITAIPSPIFLVTTYKDNGKPNACLQSWSTFFSDSGEFLCIIGGVLKRGHLYKTLLQTKECVINFPSSDIYSKCSATIKNNEYEDDEITKSGFTSEPAKTVNAPRIVECFLNLECDFLWEKENFTNSKNITICVRIKHVAIMKDVLDESKIGRYGKTGYIYNIHNPFNPETGLFQGTYLGHIEKGLKKD